MAESPPIEDSQEVASRVLRRAQVSKVSEALELQTIGTPSN